MKKLLPVAVAGAFVLFAAFNHAGFRSPMAPHLSNGGVSTEKTPPAPDAESADTFPSMPYASSTGIPQRLISYARVGKVTLYGNLTNPASIVLFLSGDGGWNQGVENMAKAVARDGQTLVAGIDIVEYYKKLQITSEKCLYPSGDLENLSEYLQKTLRLPDYHKPVLVGYSSGATLTYALLCQAPPGTFRGGVALGFCPDIELDKPLCEGSGKLMLSRLKTGKGFGFTGRTAPGAPLEVLHGTLDMDCNCRQTCDFFEQVPHVTVTQLPKVGHGYSVTKNWLPQFKQAFARILVLTDRSTGMPITGPGSQIPVAMAGIQPVGNTGDLPLSITPAVADPSTPMVLFLSGDGGWTGFDQQISEHLASEHLPVIGLNSQSYFWKKKTPEQTTADLASVIRQYLQAWGKSSVILVGYSFGANIAPFIQNRLPLDIQQKTRQIVLLSPDPAGDFEIHVAGMLGKGGGPYNVAAEIRSLQEVPVLCVSGDQEGNEMQTALQGAGNVRFEKIPGSHHYNNDATRVASTILYFCRQYEIPHH